MTLCLYKLTKKKKRQNVINFSIGIELVKKLIPPQQRGSSFKVIFQLTK
jgi:hypothetical protein